MATGGLSTFGWGIVAGGGAIAVVTGGLYFSGVLKPDAEQAPQDVVQAGDAPLTSGPTPTENVAAVPEGKLILDAPSFDVVRVEPDGTTLVAGTSPRGSRVLILLDDVVQHAQDVDTGGKFVSFLTLPISDAPRILTLVAEYQGITTRSKDQIILAPAPRAKPAAGQVVQATALPKATTDPVQNTTDRTSVPAPPADAVPDTARDQAPVVMTIASPQSGQSNPAVTNAPTTANRDAMVTTSAVPTLPVPGGIAPQPLIAPPPKLITEAPQTAQITALANGPATDPSTGVIAPSGHRVPTPEPNAIAVLRAGPDGIELLQPIIQNAASAKTLIVLDTISYSAAGEVLLSGRSRKNSLVRVYLDNDAIADLTADQDGRWGGQITGIIPGVYTLRLDELNKSGTVLSRLETPFKRETPEVLNPPAPQEGTTVSSPIRAVTVQTGDTLWAISQERYGDGVLYVRLFEANRDHIRDPHLIYPGQIFAIPE